MSLLGRLFSWDAADARTLSGASSPAMLGQRFAGQGVQAYSTVDLARDVNFPDFMRGGANWAGASLTRRTVMRNAAVRRCVTIIANAIAMLPMPLLQRSGTGVGDIRKASDHPLYRLLTLLPNSNHTAFEFRKLMQRRLLIDGNAFARIVRGRADRIVSLVPIAPTNVRVRELADGTIEYQVKRGNGAFSVVPNREVLHLRGDSDDGVLGLSLIDEAGEVLGLTMRADEAAARLFSNGTLSGTVLESDKRLGAEALENLRDSLEAGHVGAGNAHRTLILEEGLKLKELGTSGRDIQAVEHRKHQVEEVARLFGVPRPFLMLDDTSWGSGIEQLGMFFVQYGLSPWFTCWEQALARALLTEDERGAGYYVKFNERALLRGLMKDQGDFLAKLTGTGGGPQIMEVNEARGLLELPEHPDGFGLSNGAMNKGVGNGSTE